MDKWLKLLADTGIKFDTKEENSPFSLQYLCCNTLIHFEAANGNHKSVECLIRMGISPSSKFNNKSLMFQAVECGNVSVVDLLAFHNVDVNEITPLGFPLIHFAVSVGFTDIVQVLLNYGADINYEDHAGNSLFYKAVFEKYDFDTASVLFHNGAELYTDSGDSYFHVAVAKGMVNAIKLLADIGVEIDELDSKRHTPLYKAAESGRLDLVELLIENGADINTRIADEHSLLHMAISEGNDIAAEILTDAGIDVNIQGDGEVEYCCILR